MSTAKAEHDLAYLCLEYLACPQFDPSATAQSITSGIFSGFYSFADYAVISWALHLESSLDLEQSTADRLEELTGALQVFLDLQWANRQEEPTMPNNLKRRLKPLETHPCYERACSAIAVQREQLRPTGKRAPDREVLWLKNSILRVRTALEAISRSPNCFEDQLALLKKFYGLNLFKCARFSCHFFYRGFPTEDQRSQHVSKHERAFTCLEEGCPQSTIGCTTAKDLQSHIRISHDGIHVEEDEAAFPGDDDSKQEQQRPMQKQLATFQCPLCSKRFTRAFNLISHQRTHTNERPFACSVCGKAFSRRRDLKRHEETHS